MVCDSLPSFSREFDLMSMDMKALYTLPQSVGIAGGRPSSSYYFVGSQASNHFYLDLHHTPATTDRKAEREREHGVPIRQATTERGSVYLHLLATIIPRHRLRPAAQLIDDLKPDWLSITSMKNNNCLRTALPPEAHTCVGTQQARIMVGRCCRARLVMLGWVTSR